MRYINIVAKGPVGRHRRHGRACLLASVFRQTVLTPDQSAHMNSLTGIYTVCQRGSISTSAETLVIAASRVKQVYHMFARLRG